MSCGKIKPNELALTLNISLSPESEAKLRKRAAAEGKEITAFVRETIEEKLATAGNNRPVSSVSSQGNQQWFARFNEWIASHPPRQHLADDSRDAIYSDEPD